MIPFSLVFLWKNEKKIVTYAKCMDRAEKDVTSVDCNNISEDNNYKLVHTGGKAINNTELVDNQFGVSVENSYRLKRIVEVYQWVETQTKKDDRIHYYYNQQWSQQAIDSNTFHDKNGHDNPPTNWPFRSNTTEAKNVTLGDYKLNHSQIGRLGRNSSTKVQPEKD